MLINWLPMLLVGQGFSASQAAGVMFSLQIGAACGTLLLGALMDKLTPLRMSLLIYSGILASLLALGSASSLSGMLLAGFVAGLFATGGRACSTRWRRCSIPRRSAPPGSAPPWRWAVSGR
jgi:AAHS family 3-hydroxyphenylpropionic acid transporter